MTPVIVVEWALVEDGGQTVCRHIFDIATIFACIRTVKISMNLPFGLLTTEESCQCMRRSYSTTSTTAKGDNNRMDNRNNEDKNNSEDYKDNNSDSQWLEYYNELAEYVQETGGVEKIDDIEKPVMGLSPTRRVSIVERRSEN